jgi:DnaK suppressor protein
MSEAAYPLEIDVRGGRNPGAGSEKAERREAGSRKGARLEARRRTLVDLRTRLQGSASRTTDAMLTGYDIEASAASPDAAEFAEELVEQNVALGLLGSVAETLEKIDSAIHRIQDGSYGRCEDCGVKIPAARLDAIPYAERCVECAARHENSATR